MKSKLERFIEQASTKYPRYDYSRITEMNSTTKLEITCLDHNLTFYQTAPKHLGMKGYPCPECKRLEKQRELIERFKEIHGDRYDYSHVNYQNHKEHLTLFCKKHELLFPITPKNIFKGQGCPRCAREQAVRRLSKEEIIQRFREAHGDKYDYSKVEYKGIHEKVTIICSEHGEFLQEANSHQRGHGCPKCSMLDTLESMLEKVPTHIREYDFSKAVYVDSTTKMLVTCTCGETFKVTPSALVQGHGCRVCAYNRVAEKNRLKPEEILLKAKSVHEDKFTYGSLEGYKDNGYVWDIKCPVHGWFKQPVVQHLRGNGCKCCARTTSRAEKELSEFFLDRGFEVHRNWRPFWMQGEELDIYLPELSLAIEYNGGVYHHSSENTGVELYDKTFKSPAYHQNKFNLAREHGIDLIHIFDFEDGWYEVLDQMLVSEYQVHFENTARDYFPRKDVCLKVYGKSSVALQGDLGMKTCLNGGS